MTESQTQGRRAAPVQKNEIYDALDNGSGASFLSGRFWIRALFHRLD